MNNHTPEQLQRAQVLSDAIANLVQEFTNETGIVVTGEIWPEKVGETPTRVRFSYKVGLNLPASEAVRL